jgi:hypothetical protein
MPSGSPKARTVGVEAARESGQDDACRICGWRLRDGRCVNKHTTTKPWQLVAWRKRREEIKARTTACEWCGTSFAPPKKPAVVHHEMERYTLPDGVPDWTAYMAMHPDEVVVICKPCHLRPSEAQRPARHRRAVPGLRRAQEATIRGLLRVPPTFRAPDDEGMHRHGGRTSVDARGTGRA